MIYNINTCLNKETRLRNDLEVANATIKDLEAKIKCLEEESLVTQSGEEILTHNVNEVSAMLNQSCLEKNWAFIEHTNITSNQLNQSKIHLNQQGSSVMTRNFIKHIYDRKY